MAYATLADVRALGVTVAQASDAAVNSALDLASAFIDKMTRQWFDKRGLTLLFNGDGTSTLFLSVPIVSVTTVKVAGVALLTTDFAVDKSRQNPRIMRKSLTQDFYSDVGRGPPVFIRGVQNIEVAGFFGNVEDDGITTPPLIKRATLKLCLEKLASPLFGASTLALPTSIAGIVLEEETDGHRIRFADTSGGSSARAGMIGFSADQEVQDILRLYRAPIGLGMTRGAIVA